ncbi:multifunctional-autoprocessing repeats-in-toxin-like [Mytilus edulis]|uniref:multifunctional-autoprocessing repeats-in-toxin-like n=1 Tax=Mytilus edulis TaxID=6550 RepID=UPI0039F00121
MGVKMYIWTEGDENVGHGSMTLSDGITHISWWPKKDKEMTTNQSWTSVEAEPATSYEQDVEWEGKPADLIYEIPSGKLDEAAIKSWWNEFKTTNRYHIVFKNCCSAVYSALQKGGAEEIVSFPMSFLSTPANLKEYAEALQKATRK